MSLHNFVVYISIIQLLFVTLSLLKSKKRKQNGTIKELLVSLISFYYQELICFTIDMMPVNCEKLPKLGTPGTGWGCAAHFPKPYLILSKIYDFPYLIYDLTKNLIL